MATPRFMPQELGQLRELARQWAKIVSRPAFGDDGPGLDIDFRTMEQTAAHGLTEGTLELLLRSRPTSYPTNNPVPTAADAATPNPTPDRSPLGEPRSSRPNGSHTVPTVAGTFSPLRVALGLDEHGYSSSVIERVVTAAARFSSFRDATDAVAMSGIDISQSQVRRLAHEVGAELIAERDRKAVEHRRRQLRPRTVWNPDNKPWADIPFEKRPMVQVEKAPFSREKWTHVAFTVENVNDKTRPPLGKLYLNGKPQGSIEKWDLRFEWDPAKVLLVLGAAYVGYQDDLAVFGRALTDAEVDRVYGLKNGVRELYPEK